jgi:uncharacterized protein YbjT (DUF2867 family)
MQGLVTVFGGSGFVGGQVVRALAKAGYRVRVAVRNPNLGYRMRMLGDVGQIEVVQANLRNAPSVARALDGAEATINLVGVLWETGRQKFQALHVMGAKTVAEQAKAAGVKRLVHVSALGADLDSPSKYARTKALGEQAVRAAFPGAVVIRPSIMFGPDDKFFNKFGQMAALFPALPLVGGGETKFQPAFVGDVAEAVARAVDGAVAGGRIYELGGPEVKSFRELVAYICEVTGRKPLRVSLPFPLARLQARIIEIVDMLTLGLLPNELKLTRDQVTLLESDHVVSQAAKAEGRDFAGLGIAPSSVEAVVPSYLWRFRKAGQFDAARAG